MEQPSATPEKVKRILGGKGKPLHSHEVHIRRTDNKGFVARHDLRDKHGNPPTDGQRDSAEYSLANPQELLDHLQQHMGQAQIEEPNEEDQQE
jgi:hypothetical protein